MRTLVVLALLGSAFALPNIQFTAEVAAERARFMQLFNAQAAAAAAASDDPTEGARYQQAATRSQYTPQPQSYQYSAQQSNQYNAPQTHQYVPQYQNVIPGAPLKWTGPLAATVPAGVDGRITPVSDTAEVTAARNAFLNTYNAALSATVPARPHQYSTAPQQVWSPVPQTYSAAPQIQPRWTGPVAATISAGLPGAGYQVAQTADVASATAAFQQAYSAAVAATTGRRY